MYRGSRRVNAVLASVALMTVAFLALVWLGQRRLIYFPDTASPSLDHAGLAGAEPVTFDTADGLRLNAWFVAGSGPAPRPTVLVFNGNAGHRGYRAPLAAALRQHGLQVLLTDYRGYGGNPGAPSEEGLAADARAARAYLLSRPDVDPTRIVYFGESLGAAVASASPSSTHRRRSSCDRRSRRWLKSAGITTRCCRCGCSFATASRQSTARTSSARRCSSSPALATRSCPSNTHGACTTPSRLRRRSSRSPPITTTRPCSTVRRIQSIVTFLARPS